MSRIPVIVAALAMCIECQAAVSVRVLLGLTDRESAKWDGSVTAHGTTVTSVEPWRFEEQDEITGDSWRCSTHEIRLFGGGRLAPRPVVANGVIVTLADANGDSELEVKTAQGNFTVRLADIPYGKTMHALSGRAMADRIPATSQITNDPEEEDYPAAATDKNGNVWMAYVEFRHNPDHNKLRESLKEPLTDFSPLKAPTGGDQILVREMSNGQWGEPIAITEPGGDLFRPSVAVDGNGRVWAFWSQNDNQNFDVYARPVENGKAGTTIRLSKEPGSDVSVVAATDSQGRVWAAWQGWREGKAAIFAARQNGNEFSPPATVSSSAGDEWDPSIAADSNGRVTVAYDSYRNGNYDIFMRTAVNGTWGKESAVAGTLRYEAYPSIAYDRSGRLWVAYEEGGERWGKDFGAYETTGLSVYQGRAIRLIGFETDGRAVKTPIDCGSVMPGASVPRMPSVKADSTTRQNDSEAWLTPNPNDAKDRKPSSAAANFDAPRNTMPRLHIDSSGRIWIAFRSSFPIWWNPLGTVWSEYIASFDGNTWTGPIFLAHSDNLLDNRPALASTRGGELLVLGSSDGRRDFQRIERLEPEAPNNIASWKHDPYNNDLFANTISLPPASGEMRVSGAPRPEVAGPTPEVRAERASIALMRSYRREGLRLLRGDFHRHSDISMDGGGDGALADQWRYIIDAASLDWVGCCDHDNGAGREYSWWYEQKLTDVFYSPGHFSPMFNYERSVPYPEGHRNVIFVQRGIRTLPRLPITKADQVEHAPDTQMLYGYLKFFDGVTASHTSGTNMGTDWRDNDPNSEPAVEIYQGDRQNYEMPGAPRSNSADDSIGGWRPKGFVNLALEKGYKLSFEASSDHISTHMSYGVVFATAVTREAVLEALKKRHIYAATDNIFADVRSEGHMLGDSFSSSSRPVLQVKIDGTAPFTKINIVKDNKYVYSSQPNKAKLSFSWKDTGPGAGKTSYYYVRGEQQNGEIVWISPMWITYTGK
ncbi:MAG TPA: hypothetical protein VKV15_26715 [Bryobacteraceae bacterium]|nr:hypothetical protein [Bryobacteraceae bacterium]